MSEINAERCAPSEADWYVEVIHDLPDGGDCDYSYGYFKGDRLTRAFARQNLVPEGHKILELSVRKLNALRSP